MTQTYYQSNKERILKSMEKTAYNNCKCGNRKYFSSKRCRKCHDSNKYRGQVSRATSLK